MSFLALAVSAFLAAPGSQDSTAAINVLPKAPPVDSTRGGLLQVDSTLPPDTRNLDTGWVDLSARPDAPKTIDMSARIGEYYLYWSTLYTMYLATDGVGVIEPPIGFTIQSAIIGNNKLFAIQQEKNRITIKKLAFDDVGTTLVLLLTGPSGELNSVAVDIKSGKNSTTLARFIVPTNRSVNRVVEQVRARYVDQMSNRLRGQEETLNRAVWEQAMAEQQIFRIPEDLDDTQEEWKGATFRLDAVANSRDESFIYMSTDANDRECQVVDLLAVEDKKGVIKKRVELFKVRQENGRTQLIYRTSRLTPGKWKFKIKIWSKDFAIKTVLQMGDK